MAQDEFISKMDQCIEELPGVKANFDDICVYCSDRKTHDRNLADVLREQAKQIAFDKN